MSDGIDIVVVARRSDLVSMEMKPHNAIVAGTRNLMGMRIRSATVYGYTRMRSSQRDWITQVLMPRVLPGGKVVFERAKGAGDD